MNSAELVGFMTQALYLSLWLSLPPIIVAAVVGTAVSLLQALTQVQEQTLSFAIKLISVGIVLALSARWIGGELYNYMLNILLSLPTSAR
jgi:type III secretion protein S